MAAGTPSLSSSLSSLCFSSIGGGGDLALWSEEASTDSALHSQRYVRNEALQVFSDTSSLSCHSLSWNTTNTLLACSPTRGNHVAVLSCDEDRRLALMRQIEPESLLETGVSDGVGGVSSCCFLGNGHQLLIGLTSPVVSLWDLDTNTVARNYVGHSSGVTSLSRNVKDSFIVSGLENGSLTIHKVSSSQPVTQFPSTSNNGGINERVVTVSFSPMEHAMIGSCDCRGSVKLWSVESQRLLTTFSVTHSGGANDIAFSPYNRMLMGSVGQDKTINLYDLIQRKIITQINTPVPMVSLLLLRDGLTMVGGGADGNLYFYNMRNCKEANHIISAHSRPVTCLAAMNTIKTKTGRKLPSRSHRKKVTIDSSVVSNTPDNGGSPSLDSIFTPVSSSTGSNNKVVASHDSSLFSPLVVSSVGSASTVSSAPHTTVPSHLSDTIMSVSLADTPLHHGSLSSSMAGIFSPLDTSHVTKTRPPPPPLVSSKSSPLTLPGPHPPNNNGVRNLLVSEQHHSSFPADSTFKINPSHQQQSTLLVSTLPSQLHQPKVQSTPAIATNMGRRSPKRGGTPPRSPIPAHSSLSPRSSPLPTPVHTSPAHTSLAPPTASTNVQIQYMENMLKDQQEEIIWSTHRDISNLSVTMLRQFATIQNQMVVSLTAISEKVDKLTEEVESLKLQVQHLTPKY